MLIDDDMKIEMVLEIEAFPQGKGFRTLNYSWEDENEILGKNIKAVITIIIGKTSEGRPDVLHSFLNGVKRKMTLDSGAASSFILNTENPRKSRIFKIIKVSKNVLHDMHEPTNIYQSDDEDESDGDDDMDYDAFLAFNTEGRVEPPMAGLELIFCSKDIQIGLKRNENVVSIDNIVTEVTLMARVCQPGTGYNGFSDSSSIIISHEGIYSRATIARLSLILKKAENGDVEIIYTFLNGVRRKMSVDFEASKSVIFYTDRPWRSRYFSIENAENNPVKLDGSFEPDEEKDHRQSNNVYYIEKDEQYDRHYNTDDDYDKENGVNNLSDSNDAEN